MRRKACTAYSLYDNNDVHDALGRMQTPIVTSRSAVLLVQKHGTELALIARRIDAFTHNNGKPIIFDYPRLDRDFGELFDAYMLEPGYFHCIDTTRIHTLINTGDSERITLCIEHVTE